MKTRDQSEAGKPTLDLRATQELLGVEPTIGHQPLLTRSAAAPSRIRPAAAARVSLPPREREPINLLRQAADKLVTVEPEPPAVQAPVVPREPPRTERPEPVDLGDPEAIPKNDPMWYSMFMPGGGSDGEPESDPEADSLITQASFAKLSFGHKSKDRERAKQSQDEFWNTVQTLILSKRTAIGAASVLTVIVAVNSIGSLARRGPARRAAAEAAITGSMAEAAEAPITSSEAPTGLESRAALFIVDEFNEGLSDWTRPEALELTEGGPLRIKSGVALRRSTLGLRDARIEFEARVESGALGWRVRASDPGNHYEFKLNSVEGTLTRYAMVLGETDEATVVELPEDVLLPEGFNRISIEVQGDRVSTLINGRGVDFLTDPRLRTGGIGLVAGTGDSALIRKMKVVANDDFWGMVLRGAFDTLGSG